MTPPNPGNGSAAGVGGVGSRRRAREMNIQLGAGLGEVRNRTSSISGPTELSVGSTSTSEGLSGVGSLHSKAKPGQAPQEKQESLRLMPERVVKSSRIKAKSAKKKGVAGGDRRGGMGRKGGGVGVGGPVVGHGRRTKRSHRP